MYLTRRQREVFDYIRTFIAEHNYSPSLDEIATGMQLSSLATVHKHLSNLAEKGLIRRHWNKGRGIELVSSFEKPEIVNMAIEACFALPIKGVVAAGFPIEAFEEHEERLSVPSDMIRDAEESFVLRVRGDSMIEEGIHEGDFIICERRKEARNGQVVVALVNGYETTVKKFYREGKTIRLQPANSAMEPIIVNAKDCEVQGIVVGLLRKYAA